MTSANEPIKSGQEFLDRTIELFAQVPGFETPFSFAHFVAHQHEKLRVTFNLGVAYCVHPKFFRPAEFCVMRHPFIQCKILYKSLTHDARRLNLFLF
jgi:hypothetical protein